MNTEPEPELSILIPLYDERENLAPLFAKLKEILDGLDSS